MVRRTDIRIYFQGINSLAEKCRKCIEVIILKNELQLASLAFFVIVELQNFLTAPRTSRAPCIA